MEPLAGTLVCAALSDVLRSVFVCGGVGAGGGGVDKI